MKAWSIALTPEEQADLELVVRRTTSASRDVFRAGVILRAASGASNEQIAAAMKTRPATPSKWRGRFLRDRINGLLDAPRPGKPATCDPESERRILTQLDTATHDQIAIRFITTAPFLLAIPFEHWLPEHAIQIC